MTKRHIKNLHPEEVLFSGKHESLKACAEATRRWPAAQAAAQQERGMTISDHIKALDLTLEAADGSGTITLSYATVEEIRDMLAWAQDKLEQMTQAREVVQSHVTRCRAMLKKEATP